MSQAAVREKATIPRYAVPACVPQCVSAGGCATARPLPDGRSYVGVRSACGAAGRTAQPRTSQTISFTSTGLVYG